MKLTEEITLAKLAQQMKTSEDGLRFIANNNRHYFKEPRYQRAKRGKFRRIDAPHRSHKRRLRRLNRYLQRIVIFHPSVHGGRKGRSCFTAARRHLAPRYLVTRDMSSCYPSITTEMMQRRMRDSGWCPDAAEILSLLFTVDGVLPQGSPLSATALNIYLTSVDDALAASVGAMGGKIIRTYDDIVVSVRTREDALQVGALIEKQIEAVGLTVNTKKREKNGLQDRSKRQTVHNLDVSSARGIKIPTQHADEAIRLAESYIRGAKCVSADSLEALAIKRQRVLGHLHYLRQAEFSPAKHVKRLLDAGDRAVGRWLGRQKLVAHRNKWWVIQGMRNEPARLKALLQVRRSETGESAAA